jgi:hypothetical protein
VYLAEFYADAVRPIVKNGPMARYEGLVKSGRLREDSHQKGMPYGVLIIVAVVGVLDKLYGDLINYKPAEILAAKHHHLVGTPVVSRKRQFANWSYSAGSIFAQEVKNQNTSQN